MNDTTQSCPGCDAGLPATLFWRHPNGHICLVQPGDMGAELARLRKALEAIAELHPVKPTSLWGERPVDYARRIGQWEVAEIARKTLGANS